MSSSNSGRGKKRSRAQANGNEEGAGPSGSAAPKSAKSAANNKLMSTSLKRQVQNIFDHKFGVYESSNSMWQCNFLYAGFLCKPKIGIYGKFSSFAYKL